MIITLAIAMLTLVQLQAQSNSKNDSSSLILLNQIIDDYAVQKNVAALDTLFAEDFVFNHGSGKIEGRKGWFTTVARANYPLRKHDSVTVELHRGVAVVRGKMNIEKINASGPDRYWLKYVRVYALRNLKWQMISHVTTQEQHLK